MLQSSTSKSAMSSTTRALSRCQVRLIPTTFLPLRLTPSSAPATAASTQNNNIISKAHSTQMTLTLRLIPSSDSGSGACSGLSSAAAEEVALVERVKRRRVAGQ